MSDELEVFARRLIEVVRDRAIREGDHVMTKGAPLDAGLGALLGDERARAAALAAVPEVVDHVLHAADNDDLPLAWRAPGGDWVPLAELGGRGMAGELMVEWRQRYSAERFADPFGDAPPMDLSDAD